MRGTTRFTATKVLIDCSTRGGGSSSSSTCSKLDVARMDALCTYQAYFKAPPCTWYYY